MKDKTRNWIFGLIVVVVIVGVVLLNSGSDGNGNYDEEVMKCISENSKLIVSKTCSYCAVQKTILGKSLEFFELIDVAENPEVWEKYGLIGVPTWIINNQTYPGVKQIEELKDLTGC